jgi:hypothetical protein
MTAAVPTETGPTEAGPDEPVAGGELGELDDCPALEPAE